MNGNSNIYFRLPFQRCLLPANWSKTNHFEIYLYWLFSKRIFNLKNCFKCLFVIESFFLQNFACVKKNRSSRLKIERFKRKKILKIKDFETLLKNVRLIWELNLIWKSYLKQTLELRKWNEINNNNNKNKEIITPFCVLCRFVCLYTDTNIEIENSLKNSNSCGFIQS